MTRIIFRCYSDCSFIRWDILVESKMKRIVISICWCFPKFWSRICGKTILHGFLVNLHRLWRSYEQDNRRTLTLWWDAFWYSWVHMCRTYTRRFDKFPSWLLWELILTVSHDLLCSDAELRFWEEHVWKTKTNKQKAYQAANWGTIRGDTWNLW